MERDRPDVVLAVAADACLGPWEQARKDLGGKARQASARRVHFFRQENSFQDHLRPGAKKAQKRRCAPHFLLLSLRRSALHLPARDNWPRSPTPTSRGNSGARPRPALLAVIPCARCAGPTWGELKAFYRRSGDYPAGVVRPTAPPAGTSSDRDRRVGARADERQQRIDTRLCRNRPLSRYAGCHVTSSGLADRPRGCPRHGPVRSASAEPGVPEEFPYVTPRTGARFACL